MLQTETLSVRLNDTEGYLHSAEIVMILKSLDYCCLDINKEVILEAGKQGDHSTCAFLWRRPVATIRLPNEWLIRSGKDSPI